jgi:hypothetical protein
MAKVDQITSFHINQDGVSYLIIEPVPVTAGFIQGGTYHDIDILLNC